MDKYIKKGGALRDDTKNGDVAEYLQVWYVLAWRPRYAESAM